MLKQTPKNFRESFLLMLTKELIENTEVYKNSKIKKEVKEVIIKEKNEPELQEFVEEEKKEKIKEFVKEKIRKEYEKISEMKKTGLLQEPWIASRPLPKLARMKPPVKKIPPAVRIPEPALPETVSYLKPVPTSEKIDLPNLNILIGDPLVKAIECSGPNENVLVIGMMGRKPTLTKLSKEEIKGILEKFSLASKIPLHEGLFKAAVGNLVISAVISETVGIKFVIRKISPGF